MKLPKLYAFNKKLKIDLSLSENPLGCSPKIFNVLKKDIKNITKYPDPTSSTLMSVLARKFRLSKKQILVGNGSESLIDLVCRVLIKPNDQVLLPELTFPLFERAILLAKGKPVFIKMKNNFQINLLALKKKKGRRVKLFILCNPNNPTGKVINSGDLIKFVKSVSPTTVLIDEANIEFGGQSVISAVRNQRNLLVLRTFSKALGLPGLRIGVLLGSQAFIEKLRQFSQPFALNSFVEKAAIAALEDKKFIEKTRKFMTGERQFLTEGLRKREFMVFNSDANNILVEINRIFPSGTNFLRLLNQNDISVVSGKSFRGLDDRFIRISPRTRKTNQSFLQVIDKIMTDME